MSNSDPEIPDFGASDRKRSVADKQRARVHKQKIAIWTGGSLFFVFVVLRIVLRFMG